MNYFVSVLTVLVLGSSVGELSDAAPTEWQIFCEAKNQEHSFGVVGLADPADPAQTMNVLYVVPRHNAPVIVMLGKDELKDEPSALTLSFHSKIFEREGTFRLFAVWDKPNKKKASYAVIDSEFEAEQFGEINTNGPIRYECARGKPIQ